jgi:class 3 adenylate cyclase/tetratricopeptide (TPR) repeat protein
LSLLDSHFCDSCGVPLAQPPSDERASRPRPLLQWQPPQHLTEKLVEARATLEGEHKQVTVLFCDVVNSVGLSEELGPELSHELLSQFFDIVVPLVHRYEGTISQYLGDGFMALFGAPFAYEDHARRGLLSALAIRGALVDGTVLSNRQKVELSVRQGLNTGFVVIGKVGEDLLMEFTAVGDTTNVAARLQQVAAPGDILISAATRRSAPDCVELEPAGELQLKGKREPVTAYKVLGPRTNAEGAAQPLPGQLIGRERELAALEDALSDAETGRGNIVGLVGDPGLGKSRLLREFRRTLAPRRVTYIEGRCLPYAAAAPYGLVLELLRSHCDLRETDPLEDAAAKVHHALSGVGLDADRDTPYLLRLLRLTGAVQPPKVSPEAFKHRVFEILTQLTLRGSRQRPLVFALEDLHWIDAASLEFLVALSERLAGAAVLLVAAYRPGYSPPWTMRSYATQLALRPLSDADSAKIVETLITAPRRDAIEAIVAKAEGNPFFLEELARNAQEHAGGRGASISVPDTIHDVITARIDRLTSAAKRVLQAASVLGREFAIETLAQIVDDSIPVEDCIRELVRSEFMFERAAPSETTFVFRHALTQDVAYGTLLSDRRARYHALAGAAIARGHGDRLSAVAELLAHHFGLSDSDDQAVRFGLMAAENAQHRWANDQALSYFASVLRRLDAMPVTPHNELIRIDAVIGQAEVMFALGRHAEHVTSLEALRPLIERCRNDRREAAWNYWMGFLQSFVGGKPEVSIAYCREAAAIASRAGLDDLLAYSNCCLAHVSVLAGDLAGAMQAGEAALSVFERENNIYWACRTLWGMSMAANALGSWARGLAICKRALDYGNSVSDTRLIIVGWMRTGSTLIFQGRPAEGVACCDRALALNPTVFDARMIRSIRAYGRIRGREHVDAGVRELQEETSWFQSSNLRYTWTHFSLWLAEGYLLLGRTDEALDLAKAALAASETLGYRHLQGFAHRVIGEIMMGADAEAAAKSLGRAIEILGAVGALNDLAKAYVLQARLESPLRAHDLFEQAMQRFESLGTIDEIANLRAALSGSL